MNHRIRGGVHPAEHKEGTSNKPTLPLSRPPAQVAISLVQWRRSPPCKPLVAVGDRVLVGQPIGAPADSAGVFAHASVSGTVRAIEPRLQADGTTAPAVVIDNDGNDTPHPNCVPRPGYETLPAEEVVALIRAAGCVGLGGAGFPTHLKLSSALGKVDTLILNGAECEPYLTSDHRLMLEQGEKVLGGASILMSALGLTSATIGIEGNKLDAVEHLTALLPRENAPIRIVPLHTRYPQGAEGQLILAITGREIPAGGLPSDAGCAVFNVATAAAIYDAVALGRPLTHRIVTVTGSALPRPINATVPLGTPLTHLIEEGGGTDDSLARVVLGGPMMGAALADLSVSTAKTTGCLLCLTRRDLPVEDPAQACLRCGRCVQACPMGLVPVHLHLHGHKGNWDAMNALGVKSCMECGSCQYICPARIPLVYLFRTAKAELSKKKEAAV